MYVNKPDVFRYYHPIAPLHGGYLDVPNPGVISNSYPGSAPFICSGRALFNVRSGLLTWSTAAA